MIVGQLCTSGSIVIATDNRKINKKAQAKV
jgi:hypothetical protein